jgi:RNA polymerase sigma-70 factor (ECF subfamily)
VQAVLPIESPDRSPSLAALPDHALVEACRTGRREAFDVLVERHQRAVYQVCYRFTLDHADASDLTQETFLRAWRGLARFKGQSSLGTWLYRIAVNAALNKVSSRRPSEELDAHGLVDDTADTATDRLVCQERSATVRRAIAALPDRQRATVILRVYQELPHQEIATILGTSVGSVKANFFHALRNLRRLIGEHGA